MCQLQGKRTQDDVKQVEAKFNATAGTLDRPNPYIRISFILAKHEPDKKQDVIPQIRQLLRIHLQSFQASMLHWTGVLTTKTMPFLLNLSKVCDERTSVPSVPMMC